MNKQVEFCVNFKERLQERIRVESELREEKTRLLNVVKEKEGELAKERSEFTDRLQQHEQVIEVSTAFLLVSFQSCKVKKKLFWGLVIGGFHVTSSPPCQWTVTKDRSLARFVCPPAFVHFTIVICVSRDGMKTTYTFCPEFTKEATLLVERCK